MKPSEAKRMVGDSRFYTLPEVAELLSVHHSVVRSLINEGKLRAKRIGTQFAVTDATLQEFMADADAEGKVPAVEKGERVIFYAPDEDDLQVGTATADEADGKIQVEVAGIFGFTQTVAVDAEHVQVLTIRHPTHD